MGGTEDAGEEEEVRRWEEEEVSFFSFFSASACSLVHVAPRALAKWSSTGRMVGKKGEESEGELEQTKI